jgi:hypothetical protein
MLTRNLYSLTITIFFFLAISCNQQDALKEIDRELTLSFTDLMSSPNEEIRSDILAPKFKGVMQEHLANPLTFNNSLDSLSKYISIASSRDKKIKFYSWDNQEGGSWHTMETLAQFQSNSGKIIVQSLLNSDLEQDVSYTDSQIYEVNEFSVENTRYYLTFGWGTHGSGMQHKIVQVFQIAGDSLIKCTSCFENGMDLIIEYPRVDTVTFTYNPTTDEIKYSEVLPFEDGRFYGRPTKNIVTLVLDHGKFKKR